MKIIYEVNGKKFENLKKAEEYEKKLIAENEKKAKLSEERDKRRKEVDDAYQNYVNLAKKYDEDYHNGDPLVGLLSILGV